MLSTVLAAVLLVVLLHCVLEETMTAPARFQTIEEWNLWKGDHNRLYLNEKVCMQTLVLETKYKVPRMEGSISRKRAVSKATV